MAEQLLLGHAAGAVHPSVHGLPLGLAKGISFQKSPRNRLGTLSVIPRKKVLISRQSEHFSLTRFGSAGIPKVCFYFCSTVRNSEHFSLPRNGSERNSDGLLFPGIAGIQPEQTSCSVCSVFHGIIFLSEIANPTSRPSAPTFSLCNFDRPRSR